MKKSIFVAALFTAFILSGTVLAVDFSPTVMTINGNSKIFYSFGGAELKIPYTVTGTPAAVWLVINTKGQAQNVKNIRNGYLGWHYVNKIDTTIFISQRYSANPGDHEIVWDGRDENGNNALPSEYDYYLWAYDDKTPRQNACSYIQIWF